MSEFADESAMFRGPLFDAVHPIDEAIADQLISEIGDDGSFLALQELEASVDNPEVLELITYLQMRFFIPPGLEQEFKEGALVTLALMKAQAQQAEVGLPSIPRSVLGQYDKQLPGPSSNLIVHESSLDDYVDQILQNFWNEESDLQDEWFLEVHNRRLERCADRLQQDRLSAYVHGALILRDCLLKSYEDLDLLNVFDQPSPNE